MGKVTRIENIHEFHRSRGLTPPEHPLISVVDYSQLKHSPEHKDSSWVSDFYSISLKKNINGKIKYGQQEYDFDEGVMFFIAPDQVFSIDISDRLSPDRSGWMLLIHPDFLWNTSLAKSIRQYEYFDYAVGEALVLSDKEETIMASIVQIIQQEYHSNIDKFSQNIIIAQIESLLSYADRFYQRQFITRKITNYKITDRLEEILDQLLQEGLPTVQQVADVLNISPNYLSGLLKSTTGKSTQQHIHDKLIEIAKEKLSTTDLTVSEIAYELGFEHSQSFSKLFKAKTNISPLEFRAQFN